MAFNWTKLIPKWGARGKEPEENFKRTGWQPGMRPPADFFNWQMNTAGEWMEEAQGFIDELKESDDATASALLDIYTKKQVSEKFALIEHSHDQLYPRKADVYTKQQLYSKSEINSLLDNKVNLDVVRYQFNFNNNISTLPTFSAQDSLVSSYYKFGRFVNLELKCLKTKAINPQNSFVGIGTLPVGFRPSKEVSGFCIFYEKNGDYYYKKGYGVIAVFKDGQVSLSYVQEGTFGFAGQVSFLS